jgi:hypothetical protein
MLVHNAHGLYHALGPVDNQRRTQPIPVCVCVINTQCCLAAHAEGGQKHGLLRHARASTASRARTRGRRKCAASAPTHLTQWLVSVDTGPGEHIAQIRGAQGFVRPCTRAGAQAGARKRPELLRVVDPAPTPAVLEELSAGYGQCGSTPLLFLKNKNIRSKKFRAR